MLARTGGERTGGTHRRLALAVRLYRDMVYYVDVCELRLWASTWPAALRLRGIKVMRGIETSIHPFILERTDFLPRPFLMLRLTEANKNTPHQPSQQ